MHKERGMEGSMTMEIRNRRGGGRNWRRTITIKISAPAEASPHRYKPYRRREKEISAPTRPSLHGDKLLPEAHGLIFIENSYDSWCGGRYIGSQSGR
jgi:hypothetical protein